jgi:hypothetical protein
VTDATSIPGGEIFAPHPPEIVRVLRDAKASLAMASDRVAEIAIIRYAASAMERLGDGGDGIGDLSDYAIDVRGIDADTVQHAISRGIAEVLDERAEQQRTTRTNGHKPNGSNGHGHGAIGQGPNGIYQKPDPEPDADDALKAWPVMPDKANLGIVGRIAALATENSEADPVAIMATVLVYAAAEFGRASYIRIGDSFHQSRHFVAIVGQSSRGRKGTSFSPVERIFNRAEEIRLASDAMKEFPSGASLQVTPGPLSSGEGIIYAIRDATSEEDPGIADKRLLVVEEEFGTALRMFQRNGNNLSTTLRRLWDGATTAPLTKNSRIKSTRPHVNILGHITKPELASLLTGSEIWNGFANRVLWVMARRQKLVPFPLPMNEDKVEAIARDLAGVITKAHAENRELRMTDAAAALWVRVYEGLTQDYPGILGAVTSRQEAHVRRLALTYALLDGADQIEVHHLEAALAFARYAFESAAYLFGDTETDPVTQKIIEALKPGPKTQAQINDLLGGHKKSGEIAKVLEDLQERGRITMTKEPTRGAPRNVWSFVR